MKKTIFLLAALGFLAATASANGDAAKALYDKHCAKCHGASGDGKGKAGAKLKPKPTDFSDAKFQAERTDEQLIDATKNGSKATTVKVGKKMPGYAKKLNDAEIKDVVGVVRGFGKK